MKWNIQKSLRSSLTTCAFCFLYFLRHTNIKIISNIPSITTATIYLVSSPKAFFDCSNRFLYTRTRTYKRLRLNVHLNLKSALGE